jgi:hypothetical protein
MSLVTSASPWTNDEPTNRKRPSTMKRHLKQLQPASGPEEYVSQAEGYQNLQPTSLDDSQAQSQDRAMKVTELLNKVTSTSMSNDNSKMGDFNPPAAPVINVKKDYVLLNQGSQGNHGYGMDEIKAPVYSNYKKSYEPSTIPFPVPLPTQANQNAGSVPYYARMGLQNGSNGLGDSKLLEKINYMIHLLEEQQAEKTNNITEEFILYTFLGVFIIFVVDSFARAGKYTR